MDFVIIKVYFYLFFRVDFIFVSKNESTPVSIFILELFRIGKQLACAF